MTKIFFLFLISLSVFAKFSNESEFSLIEASGNSNLETYNLKTTSSFKTEKREYTFGGHYTLGETEDTNGTMVESARNWDVNAKYVQDLTHTHKTAGFIGIKVEGDKFAGIKRRDNTDLGAKIKIKDEDKEKTFVEISYRNTIERLIKANSKGEDRLTFDKGRLYLEYKKDLQSFSYKFWIEYLPNFTTSEDYQISAEPSILVKLDQTFTLKYSILINYDNLPAENAVREDRITAMSIIAKF